MIEGGNDQRAGLLLLRAHFSREQDRQRRESAAITRALDSGTIPTPEPIVRKLVWHVGREKLMRHHVYWKERKLRKGFDSLVEAALLAHLDLVRAEAALTAYASRHSGFEDHIAHTVENPAQKEVLAFCAAYVGTIDTLRRIKKARAELAGDIDASRIAATDKVEFRFLKELRNNLAHGEVTMPGWRVTSSFGKGSAGTVGAIDFSASELLAFGDWTADVRAFLAQKKDDGFPVSEVTGICAHGLSRFRADLNLLFARNLSAAERDYWAINDLSRRLTHRQSYKIVLNGIAEKSIDPYPHLHRFFDQETTRSIMRYPAHSAEQVEYIIKLKEADSHCDDDLRLILYKIFGVIPLPEVKREPPSVDPKPLGDLWPYS